MKRIICKTILKKIMFVSICVVLSSVSCGAESTQKNNVYLGKLPALYQKSAQEISDLSKKYQKAENKEEKNKIKAERNIKREELKKAIEKFNQDNPLKNTTLPFKVSGELDFDVQNVTIEEVTKSAVNFIIQVKINKDIKEADGKLSQRINVYFVAIDSNDEVISHTWNWATNHGWIKLAAGTIYDAQGHWNANRVQNMGDFAYVKIMSKADYEKIKADSKKK